MTGEFENKLEVLFFSSFEPTKLFFPFLSRGVRELRDEHLRDELEEQFK
jgi:hypothetical protein